MPAIVAHGTVHFYGEIIDISAKAEDHFYYFYDPAKDPNYPWHLYETKTRRWLASNLTEDAIIKTRDSMFYTIKMRK